MGKTAGLARETRNVIRLPLRLIRFQMHSIKYLVLCFAPVLIVGCGTSTSEWVRQTKSDNPSERQHAVQALRQKTSEPAAVVPVLTQALQDENKYVRRDAAKGLGRLGVAAQEAVPALQTRLQD